MKHITTYHSRGRHFEIVLNDEGYYLAIEDKYITDGRMNTTLNGLQMNANKDLELCLEHTRRDVEIAYLMSEGKTLAEAYSIVFRLPVEVFQGIF